MTRAVGNGAAIAEAPRTRVVGSNHYLPQETLREQYLADSSTRSLRPRKGIARSFTLTVDGKQNPDAARYYPHPLLPARLVRIKTHGPLRSGVTIEGTREPKA